MPYIYENPYKSSYLAALQELEQRKAELQFVKQRIVQLEATIKTLQPLAEGEGVAPTASLPDLCRQILMSQPGAGFTAATVMQHLSFMGVNLSGYANPLALLHTTLGRLPKRGNGFIKSTAPDGQPVYAYDERYLSDVYRRGMRGMAS